MARARLRDRHQDSLRRKLQVLKAEQAVTTPAPEESNAAAESHPPSDPEPKPGPSNEEEQTSDNDKYVRPNLTFLMKKRLRAPITIQLYVVNDVVAATQRL